MSPIASDREGVSTGDVARVLGREPRSFEDFVQGAQSAWT